MNTANRIRNVIDGKEIHNFFGITIKCILFLSAFLLQINSVNSQSQIYDDFEGEKIIFYGSKNGVLDTITQNPAPNNINSSSKCAMYVRNQTKKFDNIKMNISGKLSDVSNYATYTGTPSKIKMKVYTTAPPGTLVEILFGKKLGNNAYPDGTNSQYQAHTTVSNAWEELEFKFAQIPEGSLTSTSQIDQITLLFNPNSSSSDTYYFDDLTGPSIVVVEKPEPVDSQIKAIKE